MGKEHQHFIPKSYLKNFATEIDGKHFVQAKLKIENEPRKDLLSIVDICVSKNIYTTPTVNDESKYYLEDFYAVNIDNIIPNIFSYLTNPRVSIINTIAKRNILLAVMHLYFRTPKYLKQLNHQTDTFFDVNTEKNIGENGIVQVNYLGQNGYYHYEKKNDLKKKQREINKLNFLQNQLTNLKKFIDENENVGLVVYKIIDEVCLISSDNPIIISNPNKTVFDIFEKENIITLPLDTKHILKIYQRKESQNANVIFREFRDKWYAYTSNYTIEENSENWIYGNKGSITKHLNEKLELEKNAEYLADLYLQQLKNI